MRPFGTNMAPSSNARKRSDVARDGCEHAGEIALADAVQTPRGEHDGRRARLFHLGDRAAVAIEIDRRTRCVVDVDTADTPRAGPVEHAPATCGVERRPEAGVHVHGRHETRGARARDVRIERGPVDLTRVVERQQDRGHTGDGAHQPRLIRASSRRSGLAL